MNPPPIQHQQPLSEAAKAEVVVRQAEMVTQASVQKKAAKKKIVRIYDNPGTCMVRFVFAPKQTSPILHFLLFFEEEIRAVASKYVEHKFVGDEWVTPNNNTFVN